MTNLEAINKLNGESKDAKDEYTKLIVAHLIKRIKEDSGLGDDVAKDGKTLDGCIAYIRDQARKQASGGVAVIEDAKVYEWAEDYYRSDVKPTEKPTEKPKPKAKPKKPTPIPVDSQVSLFDDDIIDETDDLWLF
jgi:hypothetical protein